MNLSKEDRDAICKELYVPRELVEQAIDRAMRKRQLAVLNPMQRAMTTAFENINRIAVTDKKGYLPISEIIDLLARCKNVALQVCDDFVGFPEDTETLARLILPANESIETLFNGLYIETNNGGLLI